MASTSVSQHVESAQSAGKQEGSQLPAAWRKLSDAKQEELFDHLADQGHYQENMQKLESLLAGMPFAVADPIRSLANLLAATSFVEGYATRKTAKSH